MSTTIGDENPICTLGDYSKPSHEGYKNTIELPVGNNVVPLRSDTIRLVQNGCSFHGLWFEDPNQHLKDFLKLMDSLDLDGENKERRRLRLFQFFFRDQASNLLKRLPAGSITTWEDFTTRFLAQFIPPGRTTELRNDILIRTIDQSAGGKLRDRNAEESWALLEDLALYDNESWNDPRDFAKPVKYCMEDPEQAFVEYVTSRTDKAGDTPLLERKDIADIGNLGYNKDDEGIEWLDVEEPLDLVDTSEESMYESLIEEMPKCSLNYDFRIKKGDPRNLKISCMIGHKFIANAYIDVDLPMNTMSLAYYNFIRKNGYEYRGRNFVGLGWVMHVFLGKRFL
ncbi:MAK10-like protein [Tanacetum coccineum]